MFRKIIDYITSLIKKIVRRLFGSRQGYVYGRRYEPELAHPLGYEEFKKQWFEYEEEYHYNFELA